MSVRDPWRELNRASLSPQRDRQARKKRAASRPASRLFATARRVRPHLRTDSGRMHENRSARTLGDVQSALCTTKKRSLRLRKKRSHY